MDATGASDHALLHTRKPRHSERFIALLDRHYPAWRNARAELNALPLGAESFDH